MFDFFSLTLTVAHAIHDLGDGTGTDGVTEEPGVTIEIEVGEGDSGLIHTIVGDGGDGVHPGIDDFFPDGFGGGSGSGGAGAPSGGSAGNPGEGAVGTASSGNGDGAPSAPPPPPPPPQAIGPALRNPCLVLECGCKITYYESTESYELVCGNKEKHVGRCRATATRRKPRGNRALLHPDQGRPLGFLMAFACYCHEAINKADHEDQIFSRDERRRRRQEIKRIAQTDPQAQALLNAERPKRPGEESEPENL